MKPASVLTSWAAGMLLLAGPVQARGHHHTREEGIRSCDDWQVQIVGGRLLESSETLTFPAPRDTAFSIEAARNGGVSIEGVDGADYQVTVCRAVRESAGRTALEQIRVVRSATALSVTGPDDDRWVAYLIVRAPRTAALKVSAHNGPLDARGFAGRLELRSVNGPVALDGVGGEVVAETQNGPIDLERGSGDVRLRAQNGPVSVKLSGTAWDGKGLEARTTNGPLSLDVPRGFGSGVEVSASGHSPWRCPASTCSGSWNDHERVARLGSGNVVVRLSTHNGPVSIDQD